MRWEPGPVRKRHVPEPARLRQLAAKLNGQADKLSCEADALLAEADAIESATPASPNQNPDHWVKTCNRLFTTAILCNRESDGTL